MEIEFKIATEKDVPEVLTMMEHFNAIDNYPFDKLKTNKNILDFLSDTNLGRIWIIQNDNLIIGYFVLTFGYSFEHGGRDAFIDELYLKTEYRRKGIGGLVMDFISKEAPKLEVKVIHLEVERHNDGGVKLYTEKGFKDNGRILLSKKVNDDRK
ncbi:MAG: GNAT family N-acetyltransferase [Cytophagales bacterium]